VVTIIIPFQNTSPERLRNLNFLLEAIEFLRIPCIVVEQVPVWDLNPSASKISSNNILHKYFTHDGLFQKSKMINEAASECNTKYLWILDADVYLDFNKVFNEIKDQDVIKPFNLVEHLPEERTKLFLDRVPREPHESFPSSDYFGKYSLIIKRNIFESVGGFDERFEGWGWEDLDFVHNKIAEEKVYTVEASGVHLYHEKASRDNERKNFYIYKKNIGRCRKISFCMHVKNRLDQLKETLAQNLKDNRDHADLIEFVLVDFASNDYTSEWVITNFQKELNSEYLRLYKVFDFPYWHASIAKNTSHHLGEGDILVNLDCDNFTGFRGGKHLLDTFVNKNIQAVHQFCKEEWFSGNYGRIAVRSEVFNNLGGYDESFYNMGYQDTDLLERIKLEYAGGLLEDSDKDYNKAIANDKDKSIENVPPDIKEKGFFWMNGENEKRSKENIKNEIVTANKGIYGIRKDIRFYNPVNNSFAQLCT